MNNNELLNRINEDIKKIEDYLNKYPLTENRDYFKRLYRIYFCMKKKRIMMSLDAGEPKPLGEWCVRTRIDIYPMLPDFLEQVIAAESEILDEKEIVETAQKLHTLMYD